MVYTTTKKKRVGHKRPANFKVMPIYFLLFSIDPVDGAVHRWRRVLDVDLVAGIVLGMPGLKGIWLLRHEQAGLVELVVKQTFAFLFDSAIVDALVFGFGGDIFPGVVLGNAYAVWRKRIAFKGRAVEPDWHAGSVVVAK